LHISLEACSKTFSHLPVFIRFPLMSIKHLNYGHLLLQICPLKALAISDLNLEGFMDK
jgi:hypothetical protein